jgi:hypothetical protein
LTDAVFRRRGKRRSVFGVGCMTVVLGLKGGTDPAGESCWYRAVDVGCAEVPVFSDLAVHECDAGEVVVAERAAVEDVKDLVAAQFTGSPINDQKVAESRSDSQLLADLAGTRLVRRLVGSTYPPGMSQCGL